MVEAATSVGGTASPPSPAKAVLSLPRANGLLTRLAAEELREAGIDPVPVIRKAGLAPEAVADPYGRLGVAGQIAFLALAADALDDRLIGFRLARSFDLRRVGALYYVVASANTLGQGLERAARYVSLVIEGLRISARRDGTKLTLRCDYVGVTRRDDRQQVEFLMTAILRVGRQLTERAIRPLAVSFVHRRVRPTPELRQFFGIEIHFGAPRDEMELPVDAAVFPIVQADPYLADVLKAFLETALAGRPAPPSSLRINVENVLAALLPHGRPRTEDVAHELGLSRRTFERRLAEEGTSLSRLLQDLRLELARAYLADRSLSISQIAWLLGYHEVSAFTHAFHRWTGTSPTEARG